MLHLLSDPFTADTNELLPHVPAFTWSLPFTIDRDELYRLADATREADELDDWLTEAAAAVAAQRPRPTRQGS